MIVRQLVVENVVPEYSALGQCVSYRLYLRSLYAWRYAYVLINASNDELIGQFLSTYNIDRLEKLTGSIILGYIDHYQRIVQVDSYRIA